MDLLSGLASDYSDVAFWHEVHAGVIVAIIVAGILFVASRVGSKVFNITLSIITFGNAKLKRSIYERISSRAHSGLSEFITMVLFNFSLFAILFFIGMGPGITSYNAFKSDLNHLSELENRVWGLFDSDNDKLPISVPDEAITILDNIEENKQEVISAQHKARIALYGWDAFLILVVLYVTYRYFTLSYVNAVQAYFQKLMDRVNPYISDYEAKSFTAKFAKIEKKADLESLVSEIHTILKSNDEVPPRFIMW